MRARRPAAVSRHRRDSSRNRNAPRRSSPCLDFCERLCLAQAQACYYEKAVAGQSVAAPIIARLAAHAAHLYWRARAVCSYVPEPENETKLKRRNVGIEYFSVLFWGYPCSCCSLAVRLSGRLAVVATKTHRVVLFYDLFRAEIARTPK